MKETPDKSNQSRRNVLRGGLAGLAGGAAIPVSIVSGIFGNDKLNPTAPENIATCETRNATYRINYGRHEGKLSDPKSIEGCDALILEEVLRDYSVERGREVLKEYLSDPQYAAVVRRALEKDIPIYWVDAHNPQGEIYVNELALGKSVPASLEGAVAGVLSSSALSDVQQKRRQVLRASLKAAIAGYLLTPSVEEVVSAASIERAVGVEKEGTIMRDAKKRLASLNRATHPELNTKIIEGRDTLIAQKSEAVARLLQKSLGRKPVISVQLGARHVGIESELQRPSRDRVDSIKSYFGSGKALLGQAQILEARGGKPENMNAVRVTSYLDKEMVMGLGFSETDVIARVKNAI